MSDTSTQPAFDLLLAALAERLEQPSDELPSVRCASYRTLRKLIRDLRTHDTHAVLARHPVKALVAHLVATRVITPLEVPDIPDPQDRLFALGLGTDPNTLDPIDLLVALEPAGVVCYFSALSLHRLTSQHPSHHHVARLVPRPRSLPPVTPRPDPVQPAAKRKLGTARVTWQGVTYYSTQRDRSTVAGVVEQYLHDRLRCRATTVEQTLLDTLLRPASCGGPPRVFEAWETARPLVQLEKLFALLETIDHPELWRRAGYMVEDQRFPLGPAHRSRLDQEAERARNAAPVPLLPGLPYTYPSPRWQLLVP